MRAAKDKFCCAASDALVLLDPYPVLDDPRSPVTLPTAAWPSDHGLIVANFTATA